MEATGYTDLGGARVCAPRAPWSAFVIVSLITMAAGNLSQPSTAHVSTSRTTRTCASTFCRGMVKTSTSCTASVRGVPPGWSRLPGTPLARQRPARAPPAQSRRAYSPHAWPRHTQVSRTVTPHMATSGKCGHGVCVHVALAHKHGARNNPLNDREARPPPDHYGCSECRPRGHGCRDQLLHRHSAQD